MQLGTPEQQQSQVPDNTNEIGATPTRRTAKKFSSSNRRQRRKWTEQETNDLIKGCHEHGIGNWKKVLDDPKYNFNGRSSVDLKDRFRTCFPKEYRKDLQRASDEENPDPDLAQDMDTSGSPGPSTPCGTTRSGRRRVTKTEIHHAEVLEKLGFGEAAFPKVQRRERREFTQEEDERLLHGFTIYGASWSRIQNDPSLHLTHRRSTDLRDRFRNAYPDRYESAGFKARPRHPKPRPSPAPTGDAGDRIDDDMDDGDELTNPRVDPHIDEANKADSNLLIVQNLLSEHLAANWTDGVDPNLTNDMGPADQAPPPGSLALDPALGNNFEGSVLDIASELLTASPDKQGQRTTMSWEDIHTQPIFEVETSFSMPRSNGNDSKPAVTIQVQNHSPKLNAASAPRKRYLEQQTGNEEKKIRMDQSNSGASMA
ncbi:hypothetical protein FPQ18DRAFT_262019 [Pyronema domesticum]|nr:hypothetical protein FPQ18DRAFT_262019 [Pyronema domesticum]